ncbi:MAG: DNA-directed RNA polymerase subunit alpha [Anaerosomatales bacterium]|nr:DNA-directed RNA polymerase subunit alpha [Anaerosomatales bacterium]MDT8434348.1 DNA-directed RNA polymerase subunit alpha [Anaerosomatales bacterium]
MTEFMRPQVTVDQLDERVARYTVEPLERGFGYTLGNCMRRVLLSSLEGAAATSIRIEGVQHEFTAIDGVREDVTDIVLNVKQLVFRETGVGAADAVATLNASGQGIVTGADLKVPSEFELVNPEQPIATLNKGAKLEMGIRVGVGRGYVSADRNKRAEDPIGVITVDSLFSPVARCTYVVENTRVGQRTDYDKLVLEVETNGSVDPGDAVARAGRIIDEHMLLFTEQATNPLGEGEIFAAQVDEGESVLDTPIEELDLTVRSYNCLKRQGVNTIGALTECSEADLLNIRNFGAKSIEEVKDKLQAMGLGLKQ